ncbi:MAG: hypothetical protein H7Y00_11630 [Fimbriimonadaceae bacterium]|nr:hypothetical protein [Chitinophagales bacterium]
MKVSKISILFLSSLLFSILPAKISNSCAGGYWDEDDSILAPLNDELIATPELFPFFYSAHYWNEYSYYYGDDDENNFNVFSSEDANIKDWQTYFQNEIPAADISAVIYTASIEDFNLFDTYINKKGKLDTLWSENSLLKFWKENKNDPSFAYLYFSKQTEPFVKGYDYWETIERDAERLIEIKNIAIRQNENEKNDFIKLRYAYQAMRSAHYAKQYDDCLKIYDRFVAVNKTNSLIKDWCLSLRAGAYWRKGNFAEASYYNSIVFDKCLSRRLYAERDFWIPDEKTWQQCLGMAKSDREKNVLWFLTGVNNHNAAVPALYEMLKLDPSSVELEVLLAREIEKIQRNYLPIRWSNDFDEKKPDDGYYGATENNDINEIYIFIIKALESEKVRTPAYWHCCAALIRYINEDYKGCKTHCFAAQALAGKDEKLTQQIKSIILLNLIESIGHINSEIEKGILPDLRWLKNQKTATTDNVYRLIMFQLMKYYQADNKTLEAEMCRAAYVDYYDIYATPEIVPVENLYNFFINKSNSDFQNFLAQGYPYTADDMMEIKGTMLMREYKWNEAIAAFKKMTTPDKHEKMILPTDPFLIHINDCHDCDFIEHPSNYTKLTFCEKMVQLENLLSAKDMNHAQTFHELANGYYNISYWGNSWMAIDYYRCHGCETYDNEYEQYNWYYNDFFDVSKAMEYYKLATESTKNKELIALNYFMLARCEQNNYYVSDDYSYMNEDDKKINYRTYFEKIKKEYKNTQFYKDAIEECKYFEYYVSLY